MSCLKLNMTRSSEITFHKYCNWWIVKLIRHIKYWPSIFHINISLNNLQKVMLHQQRPLTSVKTGKTANDDAAPADTSNEHETTRFNYSSYNNHYTYQHLCSHSWINKITTNLLLLNFAKQMLMILFGLHYLKHCDVLRPERLWKTNIHTCCMIKDWYCNLLTSSKTTNEKQNIYLELLNKQACNSSKYDTTILK